MMELGVTGLLGQVVEVIVRCQDTETVTIHIQKMEDLTVKVAIKRINIVNVENVKLMDTGEVGHHGQAVEVIVRNQDPEAAIIQILQMEDLIVWVIEKRNSLALEKTVWLMEVGESGLLGLIANLFILVNNARSSDIETVTIQRQLRVDVTVEEKGKKKKNVLNIGECGSVPKKT